MGWGEVKFHEFQKVRSKFQKFSVETLFNAVQYFGGPCMG